MNKRYKLKLVANLVLASLLICSLIYYSTMHEYYRNDMQSTLSMIVGSIIAMSISLFVSYSSDIVRITKFIQR
jgi:hypothetical protein